MLLHPRTGLGSNPQSQVAIIQICCGSHHPALCAGGDIQILLPRWLSGKESACQRWSACCLVVSDSLQLYGLLPARLLCQRRQESWSGLPGAPPEDLPNSGTEPTSFTSFALAGGFSTTNATWDANAEGVDSLSGSGRSPRGGQGYPLQHSCLGNPMDRGAWQATVHWVQRIRYDMILSYHMTEDMTEAT